jgi:hypothetical protein
LRTSSSSDAGADVLSSGTAEPIKRTSLGSSAPPPCGDESSAGPCGKSGGGTWGTRPEAATVGGKSGLVLMLWQTNIRNANAG